MYLAQKLKNENIAEYLLYMWQVEDLIRACGFDRELICQSLAGEQADEPLRKWYEELIGMMRMENVQDAGHLQINKNIIILLYDLHKELLDSRKYPFYEAAYYKVLPFIVELRAKQEAGNKNEIETCFDLLYGVLMLKLQKREITPQTSSAVEEITRFISQLARYYHKEKNGEKLFES